MHAPSVLTEALSQRPAADTFLKDKIQRDSEQEGDVHVPDSSTGAEPTFQNSVSPRSIGSKVNCTCALVCVCVCVSARPVRASAMSGSGGCCAHCHQQYLSPGNPPCVGKPPPLLIAPTKLWSCGGDRTPSLLDGLHLGVSSVSWRVGEGQNNLVLGA